MNKIHNIHLYFFLSLLICIFTPFTFGQSSKLLDLDFKNTDLKDVLRILASQEGANFFVDPEVTGTVTLHLSKVTFDTAVELIAKTNDLVINKENNVYRIIQIDTAPLTVVYKDGLLSVDSKNAKLERLIKEITQKTGVNLILDPSIKDRITIAYNNVLLDNAIETILIQANCSAEKNNGVTFIRKKPLNPQQPFKINFQNNLLTIDAQNVPLSQITRAISEKTGVSVVPNQDVSMNITIYFQDLTLPDALAILTSSNNLQLEREGQAWRITKSNNNPYGGQGQNMKLDYNTNNQTFDVDIQNASITTVIGDMARKANINLVIMSQVNWTVNNVRVQKMKFTEVLDYLLKGTLFTYAIIDETYVIGDGLMIRPENSDLATVKVYPIKFLKADQLLNTLPPVFPRQCFVLLQDKNALIVSGPTSVHSMFSKFLEEIDTENNDSRTEIIKVKYLKAEDILKYLPASIPRNDIIVVKELNSITVTGPQNVINQVKQYIEKVDQVNPMIVFNVIVIKITDPKLIFDLGSTSVDNLHTLTTTDSYIKYLAPSITNEKAKVLSNPTITTLNGYPASFTVSTKRTYKITGGGGVTTEGKPIDSTKTLDTGLFVTITPWVADGKITMEIKPKISDYGAIPDKQEVPETFEHNTEATIRVNNNETVILSGLRSNRKTKNVTKIPILGDIPLLGYFFKKVKDENIQEEFIVIVTPHLVYNEADKIDPNQKVQELIGEDIKDIFNQNK